MSFDKARIKRFNDESSCAPPPTKYDPKTPQGANGIEFGKYSGRKDPKARDDVVFHTPAPGRPKRRPVPKTSSLRSLDGSISGSLEKVNVHSDQINALQTMLNSTQALLDEEINGKQALVNENAAISQERDELEEFLRQKDLQIEEWQINNEKVNEQIAEMEKRSAETEQQMNNLALEIASNNQFISQLQAYQGQLQAEIKSKDEAISNLEATVSHIHAQMDYFQSHLENESKAKEAVMKERLEEKAKLEETIVQHALEMSEAQSVIKKLNEKGLNDSKVIAELDGRLNYERGIAAQNTQLLQSQMEEIVNKMGVLEEQHLTSENRLKDELNERNELVSKLEKEQLELRGLIDSKKDIILEVEASLAQAQEYTEFLQKEMESLQNALQEESSANDALTVEIAEQKNKFEEAEEKYKLEKGELNGLIEMWKEKGAMYEEKINELGLKLEEAFRKEAETERKNKENVDELKNEIEEYLEQIKFVEDKQNELEKVIRGLENAQAELNLELNASQKAREKLEGLIAERNADLGCLRERCSALEASLEDAGRVKEVDEGRIKELLDDLESEKKLKVEICEALQKEKEALGEQLNFLQLDQAVLKCEVEEKSQSIFALEGLKVNLEIEIDEGLEKIGKLEGVNAELKGKNEELLSQVENLGNELEAELTVKEIISKELADEKNKLEEMMKSFEGDKATLLGEIESFKEVVHANEVTIADGELHIKLLKDELAENEQMVLSLEEEKMELQQSLGSSLEKISELEAVLAEVQVGKESVEKRLNEAEAKLELVRKAKEEDDEKLKEMGEGVEEMKRKGEEAKANFQKESEELEAQIKDHLLQVTLLKEELTENEQVMLCLEEEKQDLQTEVASCLENISNLEADIADLEGEKGALEKRCNEAEAKLEVARREKEEDQLEIKKLQEDLEGEKQAGLEKEAKLGKEIATLAGQVENYLEQLTLLKEEQAENEKIIKGLNDERSYLQSEVEGFITDIGAMGEQMKELETNQVELETQVGEKNKNILDLEEKEAKLKKEIGDSLEKVKEMEAIIGDLRARNIFLGRQAETLQNEFENEISAKHLVSEELKEEKEKAEELRNLFDEIKSELEMKSDDLIRLEANHEEKVKELEERLEEYEKKEADISNFEGEKAAMEAAMKNLMLQNKILKQNISEYESIYGDYASLVGHQNSRQKIHHVIKIKDENIRLREENAQLHKKVADFQEKAKLASSGRRRFDPAQAFKPVLKEPFIRDDRDLRGPDARSTFTVPKANWSTPTYSFAETPKKESRQGGMAFDITFTENKEN